MAIMMATTTTISWMISLLSADDIFLINLALKNYQIYIHGLGSAINSISEIHD